jgi:eukaryotic-like serine/threonine-protein kinase
MVDDAPTDDIGGPNLDVDIPAGSTHEDAVTSELVPIPSAVRDRAGTLPGRTGDRYRLGAPIAAGGMGEILTATDAQIANREVAIKRMKERNPSHHAMGRFYREACIQGRLDHPAIVPVHELGVDADGRPFFAMKRLAGTTLTQRIAGDHPRQRLLRAFADVCLAIEFAHQRGVVHRDIKPDNIVLGDFGEVYVLDWGVAKVLNESEPENLRPSGARADTITAAPMTIDGTVIGTRAYMAPEQARAERDIDGRADVYSLGCVLFEILTGVPRNRSADRDPPDPRPSARAPNRDIPPELDQLCIAATHHDRETRIQSPRELGERVERYLDGDRDLALRQQLARTHLDAARAAFEAGDAASADMRRTSMREAGRALALDPKLAGAGELVSRLMLEPPRERPPEMERMLEADNLETLRRLSKAGALAYLGFLGFLPLLFGGRPEDFLYMSVLCGVVALNIGFLLAEWTFRNMRARAIRIALGNALLLGLLTRIGSPFLIAPAVAALSTMNLVFSPNYKTPRAAVLLAVTLASAILIPWGAELAGLLPHTFHFTDTGLVLESLVVSISPLARNALLAAYLVAIIGAAAGMAFQNRKTERIVRERLHLQAWQLRHLVS